MDDHLKNKFPQVKTFEDFRSEISIIELATANGYVHEVKKGRRTPVFYNPEHQDRIIIINPKNAANQGYWNPVDDTDKGSLIHFVLRRLGTIFPQHNSHSAYASVNSVLYQYLRLDPFVRNQHRQAVPYEVLENVEAAKFLLNYYKLQPLVQTDFLLNRHIALTTLRLPEFAGKIFNVQRADPKKPGQRNMNIAFPYHLAKEDHIVGLEIRNNNFKNHAEGSDRSHGVWHSNMPQQLERVVLVESALDALAYHELKKQPNNLYVSYGGNLTLNQIQTIKELKARGNTTANFQFVAASDNDKSGANYDLMLIRDLAAAWLPSQRLASARNYIKLAFPRSFTPGVPASMTQNWKQFSDCLTGNLKFYNDTINEDLRNGNLSSLVKFDLETGIIKFRLDAGQLLVEIPNNFFALNMFNQKFIQAAGLSHIVRLDKALLKDYNEDLVLIKMINKSASLLAEINKEVLQKSPKVPLGYPDLKSVLLQPSLQERIGMILKLVRNGKEKDNPALMPEKLRNIAHGLIKELSVKSF